VGGQVDDPDAVKSVKGELDRERGQQEAENLLRHEHTALIEMVTYAVRPSEYGDVESEYHCEQAEDRGDHYDRIRLG